MEELVIRLSKVQHKNFEPGEFVEEKMRSCEEVIALINSLLWEQEREKTVSLTNASVTVDDGDMNFLKFAVYYNGKFVLHYFNRDQELYTKSFLQKEDAYPYIKNFFKNSEFDLHDFRKENTWLLHNLIHFMSQDFNYTLTPKRNFNYLLSSSWASFGFTIFFIIFFLIKGSSNMNLIAGLFIGVTVFLIGGGVNLILFFNYYNAVKNKVLIMSKGNGTFYFGDINDPVKYEKNEIAKVTIHESRGSRNMLAYFAFVKIELKDGTIINIPNLLVPEADMQNKLFDCPQICTGGVFIRRRNSKV